MDFNIDNYVSNLSYINKDFESLWYEILETVPKLTKKWRPSEANESDPLIVLLKELGIFADKINFNIDKNILERFPATLTQLRSAYNTYEDLGYSPDWYISALTGITITYSGMINQTLPSESEARGGSFVIPQFTQVSDDDSALSYVLLSAHQFTAGTPESISVQAIEGTVNDLTINGATRITSANLDSQNRIYFPETNVAQNGIFISSSSTFDSYTYNPDLITSDTGVIESWTRVDNLNQYLAGNRVYKLGVDPVTNLVYIQFPEDIGVLIGDGLYIRYILSSGTDGNIGRGDITKFLNTTSFTIYDASSGAELGTTAEADFVITNTQSTQNGADPLDIDQMREEFNRVVGTFETLVTLRDYENFIYNAIDESTGHHEVSNIRVSDRTNDLTKSVEVKIMNMEGAISTNKRWDADNSPMEPFDLRLYPLLSGEPVETKADFDATFNKVEDTTNTNLIGALDTRIRTEVIADAKHIQHDFLEPGSPVLIPYNLTGQIFLNTQVTAIEASEISLAVQQVIYQTVNSRELDWGSVVDYGALVEAIKGADSRIQYVALDAIQYESPEADPNAVENGYDVTVRNILKGNKAWTDYDMFAVSYNQTGGQYVPGSDSSDDTVITSIKTDITISNSDDATLHPVKANETVTVLIPQYNAETTYGNYLYYRAVGDSSYTASAGTPYRLSSNQAIYFFSTRDKAVAWRVGSSNYDYKIAGGTIIKGSNDILFLPNQSLTNENYVNMSGAITIDTLVRAEGSLRSSAAIAAGSEDNSGIVKIATNSEGLVNYFNLSNPGDSSYTLLSGEYLFYTDELNIELGIIGEGTTLVTTETILNIPILSGDLTNSLSNGTASTTVTNTWASVSSGVIQYKLNELYTFGENYAIRYVSKSITDGSSNTIALLTYYQNAQTFFDLPVVGNAICEIQYQLMTEGENGVWNLDDGAWQSLPTVTTEDRYQMLIRMSLIVGPGVVQEIGSTKEYNSNIPSLGEGGLGYTIADTKQSVVVETTSGTETNSITIAPEGEQEKMLQATQLITFQGGPVLELAESEQQVRLYYYSGTTGDTATIDFNGAAFLDAVAIRDLINPSAGADENVAFNAPANQGSSTSELYCVVPYIPIEASSVKYMLVKQGAVFTVVAQQSTDSYSYHIAVGDGSATVIDNISRLGPPSAIMPGAKYYSNTDKSETDISAILNGAVAAELNITYLYYEGFCPLYVPSDDELIEDPTEANSYFLSQHPYNRYVLPMLQSMDDLIISTLSIAR